MIHVRTQYTVILCIHDREIRIGGLNGLQIKAMMPEEEMATLIERRHGQGVAVVKQPSGAIKVGT